MAKGPLVAGGGQERRSVMRKYASKILLDIFLSVVATVTAAYVTHHYFPAGSIAKSPAAVTAGGPK